METIAREAGYSRSAIYRQFATRGELLRALVQRTTQRHAADLLQRIPPGSGPVDLLVESMVMVASQLVHDQLLQTIAGQTPDGTIASLIANDADLTALVEPMIAAMLAQDADAFRPGLHPHDLAQFFISTALSMLLSVVPESSDPEVARRYVQTFILPAIVNNPPAATQVYLSPKD
jgi:AcrR family transcriptional regulator